MAGHNAAASAAGYLFQTNWALVELLRKASSRPDQAISIELHDDVAWTDETDEGDARELLQIKLHTTARAAGLGDKAVDIWKTLKVWMDRSDATDPQGPDLALVTTSVASPGTAAFVLCPSDSGGARPRDVAAAVRLLVRAAKDATNTETEDSRRQFLKLGAAGRRNLINRVRVLDGALQPHDLDSSLRELLAYGLPSHRQSEDRFVAQVWLWWAQMAVSMLAGRRAVVSVSEVLAFVRELRDTYTSENLPTTVSLSSVSEENIAGYSASRFVEQLKLVDYSGRSLRSAIIDYHRAVTQETDWLSDSLLGRRELQDFQAELRFEWEREFDSMVYDLDVANLPPVEAEKAKSRAGRQLLNYLLKSTAVTVRTHYNEGFYARGKRHELAGHEDDTQRIGWHPDFMGRIDALVIDA
ncbi:hypothetical protein DQ353_17110 [Arthrobacter sp. AQ5-05]|uniref:ABC-three component system protein n=1 Tax=Arthrobacter sp. AQ5-05 TaxID=2184581 RepID=UPI000DCC5A25|nr:ABC-three component system protein [Arthrobacter sp. AQ5-05]RAX48095.1 hypothetical protein DQ353_17110 [Arthrobacter sp. AQ5-05]